MTTQIDVSQYDPQRLMLVLEVARQLSAPFDLDHLLGAVVDAGRKVLTADRGSVFLYDFPHRELYSTVATGSERIRFSIERGIAGECARTRKVVKVQDCYADSRFNPEIDRRTGYRTKCMIALPLIGLDDELVGVLQLLNCAKGIFEDTDERIAEVLASQAAAAIQRTRLLDERIVKMRLERDLAVARQIQMSFLPKTLPEITGYDMAAVSHPADQTGGDAFDVVALPAEVPGKPSVMLLVADATGHGVGPALSVTQVRAMLRLGVRMNAELDELYFHMNRQLTEDLAAQRFVTAFLGLLDPVKHHVQYHAAGQGPILVVRRDGQVLWRDASSIPMGIMDDPPVVERQELDLGPGDILAVLTDGFYEYKNIESEPIGNDAIAKMIIDNRHLGAREIIDILFGEVRIFSQGMPQDDDLTALVIKRLA